MGIFGIFKKRKKTFTKLDQLWELWVTGDLDAPCAKLMTYESEVNNGGHSQYFFNVSNGGDLAAEVEVVLSMLPEPLRGNLNRAYTAFIAQEDSCDDENEELFEECDDVFYEHEQLLIDILYKTAESMIE